MAIRAGTASESALRGYLDPAARLHVILDALPVGVVIADADGRIVEANETMSWIWGGRIPHSRRVEDYGEYRGRNAETGEPVRPEEWGLARAISCGETSVEVIDIERFDGSRATIVNSAAPITDDAGTIIGGIVAIQDITQQRQQQLLDAAMHDIDSAMASTKSARELLEASMPLVVRALDAEGALGGCVHGDGFIIEAVHGFPDELVGAYLQRDQIRSAAIAMATGKPVAVNDTENDERVNRETTRRFGIRSMIAIPFFDRMHDVGGGMVICRTGHPVPFSDEQVAFAAKVSSMASLTAVNFGLLAEHERAAELRGKLSAVTAAVTSTLEYDQILGRVVREVATAIDADAAILFMLEDDEWVVRHVFEMQSELLGKRFGHETLPLARADEPSVRIDDVARDGRTANNAFLQQAGVTALLDVAIVVDEEVIGDFCLFCRTQGQHFHDLHADFVEKAIAQLSAALHNALRFGQQRDVSENLQEALLVMPDRVEGVCFGHVYEAASESARVGGDFYDLISLGNGRVGIVIGDVSGKGIEAARMMMAVKNTIRAYVFAGMRPAEVMALTNDLIYQMSESHQFVTVFLGVLEPHTGTLTYTSAGHNPAVIVNRDHHLRALATMSTLLGAFQGVQFEEGSVALDDDDVLVLYTDGVIEARSDDELFGDRRLFRMLKREEADAETLARRMLRRVKSFAGGRLDDDVAILTVSRATEATPGT